MNRRSFLGTIPALVAGGVAAIAGVRQPGGLMPVGPRVVYPSISADELRRTRAPRSPPCGAHVMTPGGRVSL